MLAPPCLLRPAAAPLRCCPLLRIEVGCWREEEHACEWVRGAGGRCGAAAAAEERGALGVIQRPPQRTPNHTRLLLLRLPLLPPAAPGLPTP